MKYSTTPEEDVKIEEKLSSRFSRFDLAIKELGITRAELRRPYVKETLEIEKFENFKRSLTR